MKMSFTIIIRGPLGIGKTTISKKLAKILHAKYFSIDAVVDRKSFDMTKSKDGFISEESFTRANELILPKAQKALHLNRIVIIDGNFYRKKALLNLIKKLKCETFVFTLKAPLSVCIARDKKRLKPLGRGAATVVYNKTTEFNYGTIVDTKNNNAKSTVKIILKHLLSCNKKSEKKMKC